MGEQTTALYDFDFNNNTFLVNLSLISVNVENYKSTDNHGDSNVTSGDDEISESEVASLYTALEKVLISFTIGFLILATIIGNVFVLVSILVERNLRSVQNYLILSLAITDLLVAVLVMPLSLVNEVSITWPLSAPICDMWIAFDVLCCTASILHLVAISGDRFLAVSNIDYIRKRNGKRICSIILVVWVSSFSISIPPLFGWKDHASRSDITGLCMISQDIGYTLFSTIGAFYLPLSFMIILNYKIYGIASTRIRKKRFKKSTWNPVDDRSATTVGVNGNSVYAHSSDRGEHICLNSYKDGDVDETKLSYIELRKMRRCRNTVDLTRISQESQCACPERPLAECKPNSNSCCKHPAQSTTVSARDGFAVAVCHSGHDNATSDLAEQHRAASVISDDKHQHIITKPFTSKAKNVTFINIKLASGRTTINCEQRRSARIEMRRERKAARVLLIITGSFVVCWLPFFIIAITGPFCTISCVFPGPLVSFFLWLGYFNSFLNPIIYTIFNPHFRTAFNKLLSGKCCRQSYFIK